MSASMVEKVLWEFTVEQSRVDRFRADPARYLDDYALTVEEKRMLASMDVRAMAAHSVSPLLTMMTWVQMEGQASIPRYLEQMNATSKRP